ncbi:glycosyltransferase involved in cell wall biosynthesis [Methylohalomonas lacus]|uniref:Glycosyltransferase involved in cell wall biosynthesis n=1 Tax=Methylohalomonas lacus TaxID=398773 RepID=A0AAE3HM60_9GAMM|nr:glycosyltransferase family A protein [Methylohalomonas lacus]MCS3904370.1 glycosyltransferase involved in cell wall biosynthesis [Methylohalomonas lacus]
MSQEPLVSVVIPVKNRRALFEDALSSVFSQTYRPIEVIVVDDASTDDILESINTVRKQSESEAIELKYIRSDKNLGPGGARELGRQHITGAYVSYLDSDTRWKQKKLAAQVELMEANKSIGMCYTGCMDEDIYGNFSIRNESLEAHKKILPIVLIKRPWGTSSCMWRRQVSDQIGSWRKLWISEDAEYEVRAGCYDINIASVHEILTIGNTVDSSRLSRSAGPENRLDGVLAIIETLDDFNKLDEMLSHNKIKRRVYNRIYKAYSDGMMYSVDKENKIYDNLFKLSISNHDIVWAMKCQKLINSIIDRRVARKLNVIFRHILGCWFYLK